LKNANFSENFVHCKIAKVNKYFVIFFYFKILFLFQTFSIVVKAIAGSIDGGADRSSEATVLIELSDVNHYTPQFTHRVSGTINDCVTHILYASALFQRLSALTDCVREKVAICPTFALFLTFRTAGC
jgi:hypothetical protein